jgi:hypothetical protein
MSLTDFRQGWFPEGLGERTYLCFGRAAACLLGRCCNSLQRNGRLLCSSRIDPSWLSRTVTLLFGWTVWFFSSFSICNQRLPYCTTQSLPTTRCRPSAPDRQSAIFSLCVAGKAFAYAPASTTLPPASIGARSPHSLQSHGLPTNAPLSAWDRTALLPCRCNACSLTPAPAAASSHR